VIVLVPTIPHTGTTLVLKHLLPFLPDMRNPKRCGHGKIFCHIYEERIAELLPLLEKYPAVIPLRHPEKVAISWKARKKDLNELWGLWETLVDVIDPYHPLYLAIDSAGRDQALRSISKTLGLDLKTDWSVIASTGLTATLTEEEKEQANRFEEFYVKRSPSLMA